MESAIGNPSSLIPRFPPVWAEVFGEDRFGIFAECSVNEVRFVWRWIPPGSFLMGSPESENGRFDAEGPQHRVTLTRGYWLGETPVTQAQWERACRAGTQGAFHIDGSVCALPEGKDPVLDQLGWFGQNSEGRTHDVKAKAPNAWGLYDMHGNVWEWCRDAWMENYQEHAAGVIDPEKFDDDERAFRVLRGGSWGNHARNCRAACRFGGVPGGVWRYRGLRLAAGQNEPGAAEPLGAERPQS